MFEEMGKFDSDKANEYRTMFETVKQQLTQQLKRQFIQQGKKEGVVSTITTLDNVLKGDGLERIVCESL